MSLIRSHILVCTGTGCTSSESPKIIAEFEKQLAAQGMDKEAQVVRTGCFGLCALGPIVTIYPEGACYTHVTVDDVEEIVSEHIVKGRIVKRLLNKNEGPLHGLDGRWLYRLRIACCLHDIGFASGRKGHHKKGMRIVEQDTSLALLPEDRSLVAQLVRYHRKAWPALRHRRFAALGKKDREA